MTTTTTRMPISAFRIAASPFKRIRITTTATTAHRSYRNCKLSTIKSDTSVAAISKDVYNPNSTRIIDADRETVTQLVDQLLERTRHLMTTTTTAAAATATNGSNKDNKTTTHRIKQQFHHTIAYSGGIDSSLVAAVVYQISQELNGYESSSIMSLNPTEPPQRHNVTAVLGISPAVSMEQIQQAEDVALHIGIPFVKIPTEEGTNETYIANNGQACFACKSELYTKLIHHTISNYTTHPPIDVVLGSQPPQPLPSTMLQNTHIHRKLYNGTNADDCLDPTRVGLIAASQNNVLSPLNTLTKEQVRQIAKHLQLPNWNVASNPCLRSRLAMGIPATQQHLQRIEHAERYIRQQLNDMITVETNLRVRLLSQQRGCLEIDTRYVDTVTNLYQTHHNEWDQMLLHELQFRSFTIRPFRSGSVAATMTTSLAGETPTNGLSSTVVTSSVATTSQ